MDFIDRTVINIRSGRGGPGASSFKRARNMPRLGPDGGDGGFGGSVFLEGCRQLNTLATLRYKHWYKAEDGQKGGTNGRTGANGPDLVIPVPLGTVAYDEASGQWLGEVLGHGERLCLARGGKRGLGNLRYVSSTRQAPERTTSGGPAINVAVRLELKLLADVGLAGFPNAGKSTLLSQLSAARPKIADYPFTTLVPNLGVVELGRDGTFFGESFVIADVPGLIEGASQGRGLGLGFLRHLERTKILVYVLDCFSEVDCDPEQMLAALEAEMRSFDPAMLDRPSLVVVNKKDLAPHDFDWQRLRATLQSPNREVAFVSGATGEGLLELKLYLAELLRWVDSESASESSLSELNAVERFDVHAE